MLSYRAKRTLRSLSSTKWKTTYPYSHSSAPSSVFLFGHSLAPSFQQDKLNTLRSPSFWTERRNEGWEGFGRFFLSMAPANSVRFGRKEYGSYPLNWQVQGFYVFSFFCHYNTKFFDHVPVAEMLRSLSFLAVCGRQTYFFRSRQCFVESFRFFVRKCVFFIDIFRKRSG